MPISRSAKKSLRKSLKNRGTNFSFKSKLRGLVKKYLAKPTEKGLTEVHSVLDKSAKKYIYHKNKVARLKAKMTKKLVKPETAKAVVKKAPKKVVKKTTKRTAKEKISK